MAAGVLQTAGQLLLENLQGISESTQGLTRRIPQNK